MPPGPSRMFTPDTAVEIWKSAWVTSRAQPPPWMRLWALLKEAQNCGMSPTSVGGGLTAFGNCDWSFGFCGPGSLRAPGVLLMAPSGGSSGLPKVAACAGPAASTAPPAAAAASTLRRERKVLALVTGRSGTALSTAEAGNSLIVMVSSTAALRAKNASQSCDDVRAHARPARTSKYVVRGRDAGLRPIATT